MFETLEDIVKESSRLLEFQGSGFKATIEMSKQSAVNKTIEDIIRLESSQDTQYLTYSHS